MKYSILLLILFALLIGCEKDTSVVSFEKETLPDLAISQVTVEQFTEPDSSIRYFYTILVKNVGDTLFDDVFFISVGTGDNNSYSSGSSGSFILVGETDTLYFRNSYSSLTHTRYKNHGAIIKINKIYSLSIPQVQEKNYENNSYIIANWPFK